MRSELRHDNDNEFAKTILMFEPVVIVASSENGLGVVQQYN